MMTRFAQGFALAIAGAVAGLTLPAAAQVAYQPFVQPPPSPYGYPAPGGFLQPDEVLGTSPSFQIFPFAYGNAPAVRVVQTCQYPDGWNLTDLSRDVNGIPGGLEHECHSYVPVRGKIRARF